MNNELCHEHPRLATVSYGRLANVLSFLGLTKLRSFFLRAALKDIGKEIAELSEPLIYVNGKFLPKSQAKVSVFDEGVTHDWAVYEGIRVYDGKVVELDAHIDRLYASAKGAYITIPLTSKEFREAIIRTVRENRLRDCHMAPWVGYDESGKDANVVIRIREAPSRMGEPLTAIVSSVRRAAPDSIPA